MGVTENPADRIRAIRLALIRELERLLKVATNPAFSGTVVLEVSSKTGILGDKPWVRINQSGFSE